ncbi:hypothetical protein BSL78_01162 [Apostichopus japonicus]|uniref:Uncharacterized protein n=1 Tax=Stichopus japonicus TaxID=307972 RepID=A0A2G8LNW9_STIJA|nr:hypothetical protein BSL78_01162 [Apostichopus japonicus]
MNPTNSAVCIPVNTTVAYAHEYEDIRDFSGSEPDLSDFNISSLFDKTSPDDDDQYVTLAQDMGINLATSDLSEAEGICIEQTKTSHLDQNTTVEYHIEYASNPSVPSVGAVSEKPDIDPVAVKSFQRECSDFSSLVKYLETGELPEDQKAAKKVVEAEQYVCLDGTLYHLFYRRARNLSQADRDMRTPLDVSLHPTDTMGRDAKEHITSVMDKLDTFRKVAKENIVQAQHKNKQTYDANAKEPSFHLGQSVLVFNPQVPQGHSSKLHRKWCGPYYVCELGPNDTFKLRNCSDNKELQSLVHANRLKPYHDPGTGKCLLCHTLPCLLNLKHFLVPTGASQETQHIRESSWKC